MNRCGPNLAQRCAKLARALFKRWFAAKPQDQLWGRMVERQRKGTLTPPPVVVVLVEETPGVKERVDRN